MSGITIDKYNFAVEALLSQCMAMRRAKGARENAADTLDPYQRQFHANEAWHEIEDSVKFLEHVLLILEGGFRRAMNSACERRNTDMDKFIPQLVAMHSLLPPVSHGGYSFVSETILRSAHFRQSCCLQARMFLYID